MLGRVVFALFMLGLTLPIVLHLIIKLEIIQISKTVKKKDVFIVVIEGIIIGLFILCDFRI